MNKKYWKGECEKMTDSDKKQKCQNASWYCDKVKIIVPCLYKVTIKATKMYSNLTEPESVLATAYPDTKHSIHYSRPTTIFAAVAASIFTVVGVTGL